MVNRNIQMKKRNNGEWENLFPLTLFENIYNNEGTSLPNYFLNLNDTIDTMDEKFTNKLEKTVLNGKDYGLTGDESFNATQTMIDFFQLAKDISADVVIIPEGTHILDGSTVRYENNNSTLIFEGIIKLNDYGTQMGGSIINFRANNLIVKNFKVDGDRENNVYNAKQRGTQFNFASYVRSNIVFIGGWSKNALQSSFQSSSNMVFKDFLFKDAGEHHAYLTANEGVDAHDYMIFENCEFYNWSLDTSGGAISGRDYYYIKGSNLKMVIEDGVEPVSAHYISSYTHRDTIGQPSEKHHIYENIYCKGSTYMRTINSSDMIPLTIRDSYVEGFIVSREGSENVVVENTTIIMNTKFASTPEVADKYFNCKFFGGRLWAEKRFEMHNCEVYCDENTHNQFISLNSVPNGENTIIDNVMFVDFADYYPESDLPIMNSKSSDGGNLNVITNNNFKNCGGMVGIGRISIYDIVTNNHDLDGDGVRMVGHPDNPNVTNNTLIDERS